VERSAVGGEVADPPGNHTRPFS